MSVAASPPPVIDVAAHRIKRNAGTAIQKSFWLLFFKQEVLP
jgi:hypothetical protein